MGTIKSRNHIAGVDIEVEATIGDGPYYVSYVCPECSRLKAEIERLRFGIDMIMRCAGAPDPVGALHTVIEIARKALDAKRGEG